MILLVSTKDFFLRCILIFYLVHLVLPVQSSILHFPRLCLRSATSPLCVKHVTENCGAEVVFILKSDQ